MASSTSYNPPCAACKFLRRKCVPDCVFAPYFPPEDTQKFMNVHKIFGASNVTKLINDVLPDKREDVVSSLAYEAMARVRDPVYGCVGVISFLQQEINCLQHDLDAANAALLQHLCNGMPVLPSTQPVTPQVPYHYVNCTWNWQTCPNSRGNMSGNSGGGGGSRGSNM